MQNLPTVELLDPSNRRLSLFIEVCIILHIFAGVNAILRMKSKMVPPASIN